MEERVRESFRDVESAEALSRWAESLYRDYRLPAVHEWKKRHRGRPAIGYMPIYVPLELLHAQKALPVAVLGGGDDLEIIRGDAFYQSYICHIPRSTIELGLNGSLDVLDGVLFPAICDVIRNLSGIWKMKFPDKLVRYLDVPQDFDRDVGGIFYRQELEELSRDLVEHGAEPLSEDALKESIAVHNDNRSLVRELYASRRESPWKVPSSELYCVLRASLVMPVEDAMEMLRLYAKLVEEDEERRPMDQARVVFTGPFCEQPPLGLIKTLERAGCYIVDDDLLQIHRFLKSDVPVDGDPLWNLVVAFLEDAIASPTRYIDHGVKGQELVERIQESKAEGVLFGAPSFCDPALLDQPMAVEAVEAAGIPWTAFKYSENGGQFQVIREQAGTFADSIKLWSEAS
jgi:benzoyl-CoA reductase subunit C